MHTILLYCTGSLYTSVCVSVFLLGIEICIAAQIGLKRAKSANGVPCQSGLAFDYLPSHRIWQAQQTFCGMQTGCHFILGILERYYITSTFHSAQKCFVTFLTVSDYICSNHTGSHYIRLQPAQITVFTLLISLSEQTRLCVLGGSMRYLPWHPLHDVQF